MNASLGAVSAIRGEVVHNTPSPKIILAAVHPVGNAGGATASKYSQKVGVHGVAVGVGTAVGAGVGVGVAGGVAVGVGAGVGDGPARKAFRTDSVTLSPTPPLQ